MIIRYYSNLQSIVKENNQSGLGGELMYYRQYIIRDPKISGGACA